MTMLCRRTVLALLIPTILAACRPAAALPTVVISIPSAAATSTLPFVEPTSTGAQVQANTPTAPPTATPVQDPPTPVPALPSPPAPVASGQVGPTGFPADVNPLTGLAVIDPSVLDRRPLAIKVSNFPACVRPQSGLSLADLVFEHYAEGPTTRFTAIFYTNDAPRVGSVRSARLVDLELPAMYQALLAFSGASPGVLEKLKAVDFKDRLLSPDIEPGHRAFFRVPIESLTAECQVLEHSLFTSTDRLWTDADAKGVNQRPAITGMAFNAQPPPGGQPANVVSLAYDGVYVRWTYSETAGQYYRYANGQQHTDALTGAHITTSNGVVVFAHHVFTLMLENLIGYDPRTGKGGSHSIEIQLWGTGPALVFRDGQMYPVTWLRQERAGVLGLVDSNGQLFPLKPGNTWFQLAPLDSPTTQPEAGAWEIKPTRLVDRP